MDYQTSAYFVGMISILLITLSLVQFPPTKRPCITEQLTCLPALFESTTAQRRKSEMVQIKTEIAVIEEAIAAAQEEVDFVHGVPDEELAKMSYAALSSPKDHATDEEASLLDQINMNKAFIAGYKIRLVTLVVRLADLSG